MGIHGLTQLLCEAAPGARKESQLKDHFGRKIAIDARLVLVFRFVIGRLIRLQYVFVSIFDRHSHGRRL